MNAYVVWNNKGGVGKSTITFNLAARYAELHPDHHVLILDLCPQANVTMTLLGGGHRGEDNLLQLQKSSDTIVGYIDHRISGISGTETARKHFHLQVSQYNDSMPENLWLVAGDGNLELIAPAISYYANAQIPVKAWENVHGWIKNLIEFITEGNNSWTVFIDTNPSFSIYTELAIVAGTHLLVPFKADDSSRVATKALFALLYGSTPRHPVYDRYTFATKAHDAKIPLPLCHLFIGNQFTQYLGSARAFQGMSEALMTELWSQFQAAPNRYTDRSPINSLDEFQHKFVYELRDFNSAGVVAAHQGRLLSQLTESKYKVYNTEVPLDKGRIKDCSEAVDAIIQLL